MAAILRLARPDQTKALPRKIKFTVAALAGIKTPPDGRVTIYDAKQPGLAFTVTDKGTKSFYVIRRIHGRPTRLRIGGAEMTVDQARTAAAKMQGDIAGGDDPAEDRRQERRAIPSGTSLAPEAVAAVSAKLRGRRPTRPPQAASLPHVLS